MALALVPHMKGKKLLINRLSKAFPDIWFKDGKEFDHRHGCAIWTGEGSYIDGIPAFDMYNLDYVFGVHPKLAEALEKLKLFAEAYDGGTFFIYEI